MSAPRSERDSPGAPATGDLDLLVYGDAAPERIVAVFREICGIDVEDDGVVFKPETLQAEPARAEDEYSGVRITMTAEIAGARLPIQIDIGFGNAVTPAAQEIDYPSLLDMPAPRLRAYPPETVVAEKRAGSGYLNSFALEIRGFLPGFLQMPKVGAVHTIRSASPNCLDKRV